MLLLSLLSKRATPNPPVSPFTQPPLFPFPTFLPPHTPTKQPSNSDNATSNNNNLPLLLLVLLLLVEFLLLA